MAGRSLLIVVMRGVVPGVGPALAFMRQRFGVLAQESGKQ